MKATLRYPPSARTVGSVALLASIKGKCRINGCDGAVVS